MELQAPSILAHLPRPLGASAGKCQVGEVHGVEGSKKRKRYEVAVAIDGESVNIYNVQFPKLLTSYAVPPQSSFSCPPCSVRQKSAQKNSIARRQTYCAIEQPENQVQCFLDESTTGTHNALNITNTTFKLKDSNSPVVFIGIVPTSLETGEQRDPFDVLAVHKDGRIRRLSPDLQTQKWNVLPNTGAEDSTKYEVQASFLVGFEDARKSLFKRRQDIVATVLGDELGAEAATSVIVLISRPSQRETLLPSDIKVDVFSVSSRAAEDDFALSHTKRVRHLMTIKLPNLEEELSFDSESMQWNFYPTTSGLSLSSKKGLINYDVSQYSPEVSSHMILPDEDFSSILRISPQSIIGAGKSSVAIYNTRFQSIQADLSLANALPVGAAKSDSDKGPISFVSYFTKLGIAIAKRGETLLGFDLASPSHDRYDASLKQSGDGLLINAIGKGIQPPGDAAQIAATKRINHMRLVGLSEPDETARWADIKKELDALAAANDHMKFDKAVRDAFSLGEDDKSRHLPSSDEFVDPEKILYLLGKVFSVKTKNNDPKTAKLVVSFMPRDTFKWLISSHHLSLNNIQAALRQSMHPKTTPPIPSGSLVRALADPGRSIKILLQLLREAVNLDATELAHALNVFLDIARSQQPKLEEELPKKAITEFPQTSKENANTAQEIANNETPKKPSSTRGFESTITQAMTGLNLTLTRLHSHPLDKVTQAIRSVLSNSDTLSIIHHLRHSLATGGYTSRFIEQSQTSHSSGPKIPPLNLATMVDILTACIDAIGPSGWISAAAFAGAEDSEACLIADMKSEISAALVGVEEATYLKGILREFVRYAETATTSTTSTANTVSNVPVDAANDGQNTAVTDVTDPSVARGSRLKRKERHNGAEILIYDTEDVHGAGGTFVSDTQMLPLSLKRVPGQGVGGVSAAAGGAAVGADATAGDEVSRKKIRKTGEVVQRSEREMGYLRRKAVGKYSFERIIV
ncbi:hypothetical protein AJ79_03425 [Helicocarpus griseus UAMH5409]|uniref:Utp8 beta-propeller domain-containing protein n=1 Tax=Helicocarpus griseus UAMH5409 TaxID=1447875 RepID=A0A2B7XZF9_9EURO|nr:hypothetical protein AJ79_03425 [Helicocarpus griseus UAMH5409]